MTQIRDVAFAAPDTSALQNRRFVGTIPAGVYSGYRVRVSGARTDSLDLIRGTDSTSILVTSEGRSITETDDVIDAARVAKPHPSLNRKDLLVCEYKSTTDNLAPATYKVITGRPSSDPVAPEVENVFQVPIAVIDVAPGSGLAILSNNNLLMVPRATETDVPLLATLKPELDPSDPSRLFVQSGQFLSADGSTILRYDGGYSEQITASSFTSAGTRWFRFGLSDELSVDIIGSADTEAELPDLASDVVTIATVSAQWDGVADKAVIGQIKDDRFPITRRHNPVAEVQKYQDLLSGSVFRYLLAELFTDESRIDLDTLTPDDDDISVTINKADSSLEFELADGGSIDEDVTVTTVDLLGILPVGAIEHFMVSLDSDIPGLEVQFSPSSKSGPFSPSFPLNSIRRGVLGDLTSFSAGAFFLRFVIPREAFDTRSVWKIFSYGFFAQLDADAVNNASFSAQGLTAVQESVVNLIANGDFRYWSRVDASGEDTDPDSPDTIEYAFSSLAEDIDADVKGFAADGWQFTRREFESVDGVVSRVVVGQLSGSIDTALAFTGTAGSSDALGVNELEYRVDVQGEWIGKKVTYAFDYQVSAPQDVTMAIVFYSRSDTGNLTVQARYDAGVLASSGTAKLISGAALSAETYAIGFIIRMNQTTGTTSFQFNRARAAIGEFQDLPYTRPLDPQDILRRYYERGTALLTLATSSGAAVGISQQLGSVKALGLAKDGALRFNTRQGESSNRSAGVSNITVEGDRHHVEVAGTATLTSEVRLDVDWECEVVYNAVAT